MARMARDLANSNKTIEVVFIVIIVIMIITIMIVLCIYLFINLFYLFLEKCKLKQLTKVKL